MGKLVVRTKVLQETKVLLISAGSDLCEEFVIEYELEGFAPLISSLYRLAGSLAQRRSGTNTHY